MNYRTKRALKAHGLAVLATIATGAAVIGLAVFPAEASALIGFVGLYTIIYLLVND